jgi:hypothetical protein
VATFDVADGETTEFICRPHGIASSLSRWIAGARGNRTEWILLEPVASMV